LRPKENYRAVGGGSGLGAPRLLLRQSRDDAKWVARARARARTVVPTNRERGSLASLRGVKGKQAVMCWNDDGDDNGAGLLVDKVGQDTRQEADRGH
jgi:hypothetical protein